MRTDLEEVHIPGLRILPPTRPTMVNTPPPSGGTGLKLPSPAEMPPPSAANFFHFSWNGVDVQMLVGYIDMTPPLNMVDATELPVQVQQRVFMSVRGFATLKAQMDEVANALKAQGVPLDELNPLRPL